MATLLILGGMLLMLTPLLPKDVDEASLIGVSRALRSMFTAEKPSDVPADMTATVRMLDDIKGVGE